jgi:DNA-binding winged helix-turn-helix (wHTH) protein
MARRSGRANFVPMNLTASPRLFRDLPPSASPSEERPVCGEAFSTHAWSSRRSAPGKAHTTCVRLHFDGFELDEVEARLTRAGQPVALAPKPFAVLCALARARGKLVTKNALRDLVWGHRCVTDAVLKSAMSEVRAALDDDSKQPRYIETVCRHGYRFIAPAVSLPTQSAPGIERDRAGGQDHPALAALMTLCRGDAALADLIRAVAATLERDATLTAFPPNADDSITSRA